MEELYKIIKQEQEKLITRQAEFILKQDEIIASLEEAIVSLETVNASLKARAAELESLEERVEELEGRLTLDSNTSSKPPSSNGLKKQTRKPISLRNLSKPKRGQDK